MATGRVRELIRPVVLEGDFAGGCGFLRFQVLVQGSCSPLGGAVKTPTRILIAMAIGAVGGAILGAWGDAGGWRGMMTGVVTVGFIPLLLALITKRKT